MDEFPKALYLDGHVDKPSTTVQSQQEQDTAKKEGFLPLDPMNPFPDGVQHKKAKGK